MHQIKTQILDITTNSTEGAFELQQALSDFFYASILPALEKTFDELTPGDQLIYLDRMEIDLGLIEMRDIKNENWSTLLIDRFTRELRNVIHIHKIKAPAFAANISVAQQWIYYMEQGYLPWNTIQTDSAWYQKVLEGLASDSRSIDLLRSLIRNNHILLKRIVWSHDTVFLSHLVEVLTARKQSGLGKTIPLLIDILDIKSIGQEKDLSLHKLVLETWEKVFLIAATLNTISQEELAARAILSNLDMPQLGKLKEPPFVDDNLQPILSFIQKEIEKRKSIIDSKLGLEEVAKEQEKQDLINLPEEGLFIVQAGLVLLYPFLQTFFKYACLMDGPVFKNKTAQQEGVLYLYWMATGKTELVEHELVISKILCGYPLNEPIEPGLQLQPESLEAAASLLQAVIDEWSILKNTSISGLREEFLQRSGKLIAKDRELRLLVESGSVDVLLDHLPWNISVIKLPWMPAILKVDWR